jgi:DNA-binding transcriptional LysR family regulator
VREIDLNDLRVFVRVVDRGSFAGAARELGVPTSTVSRAIARLEASTGTRLLHRSPRSVHATSEGRAAYTRLRETLGALETAARALEPATRQPKGLLRVTAAPSSGSLFLAEVAVAFGEQHPLVQIDLTLTNRAVNLVEEGFDIALRAASRLADSSLVARKLGEVVHVLYAAPSYLDRHGAPASPVELAQHACVVFRGEDLAKTWRLHRDGETVEVPVRGRMGGDDFGYLRDVALAGGGVALMPRFMCARDEAAGRLVRVLPGFEARGAGMYLMYPSASHVPPRVTAFRDFVVAAFEARSGGTAPTSSRAAPPTRTPGARLRTGAR